MNDHSRVLKFTNHPPIRIGDPSKIETVWRANPQDSFYMDLLLRYQTEEGEIYWAEYHRAWDVPPSLIYLASIPKIKKAFRLYASIETYHSEVEAIVNPASIVDVDDLVRRLSLSGMATH